MKLKHIAALMFRVLGAVFILFGLAGAVSSGVSRDLCGAIVSGAIGFVLGFCLIGVTGRFKMAPSGSKGVPFGTLQIPHLGFLTQCSDIIVPDNIQISCFPALALGGIGLCRSAT